MTAFVANTNLLEVNGISSATDGTFLNSANVTVVVSLTGGAMVSGVTWPQTMAYVAGSNGNYQLTLPSTAAFIAGQSYTAAVSVDAGAEGVGSYAFNFQVQTRTVAPATSDTYAFAPTTGDVILQAYRRIGITRPSVDRDKLTDARIELNTLFASWSNQGPNLWTVDLITLPLVAGVSTYAIDPATIELLDTYIETGTPATDQLMASISRSDFAAYPNKTQSGKPTVYWFDRTIAPTLTVWPVPDTAATYTLKFYRWRQIQDAGTAGAQTLEIPYRWLNAVIWGLAENLSFIYAPDRTQVVAPKAQAEYQIAASQDTENAPVRFMPDMSGYFR